MNGEVNALATSQRCSELIYDVPLANPPKGKRGFDIVVSAVLAAATAPLQVVGLAVSAVAFRSFPIFFQSRVGMRGDAFTFLKIRSLPSSAPSEAPKHDIAAVSNTRAGTFLRRTHLDELLQLWSVLRGDMSIVGPRPEMLGLSSSYHDEFVRQRTSVRPGITGLWQISEGSDGLIGETAGYDLYYLRNQSWRLDLWIMLRTAPKMFLGTRVTFDDLDESKLGALAKHKAIEEDNE